MIGILSRGAFEVWLRDHSFAAAQVEAGKEPPMFCTAADADDLRRNNADAVTIIGGNGLTAVMSETAGLSLTFTDEELKCI